MASTVEMCTINIRPPLQPNKGPSIEETSPLQTAPITNVEPQSWTEVVDFTRDITVGENSNYHRT